MLKFFNGSELVLATLEKNTFISKEEKKFFTQEELSLLSKGPVPHHVAIIMDGNRRWARKKLEQKGASGFPVVRKKDLTSGHHSGAANVLDIIKASIEIGIGVLTLFGFSTENWKRSSFEVDVLLKIFENFITENRGKMVEQGVRFRAIGDLSPFPDSLKKEIEIASDMTRNGSILDLVIGLNYGGRDEMCRAFKKMHADLQVGLIDMQSINPELIHSYLDTAEWPDPDLLIRTSGEMRVSNFLLWQLAYAEIYVTDVFWPDFVPKELFKAIRAFQIRERRIGI